MSFVSLSSCPAAAVTASEDTQFDTVASRGSAAASATPGPQSGYRLVSSTNPLDRMQEIAGSLLRSVASWLGPRPIIDPSEKYVSPSASNTPRTVAPSNQK